jgi:hypothetical protein
VKTEVLDRNANRDRKDKTEDLVLQDRKARVVGRDRSADRDRKGKKEDHVLHVQRARTVQTQLLL